MKKALFALAMILVSGLSLMAQNQYEMNIYHQGAKVLSAPAGQTDSIKFNNNQMTVTFNNGIWNRSITNIDSIVFAQMQQQDTSYTDTTAIDTNNAIRISWTTNGVVVVNGFASQGVSINVSGNDVEVNSTCDSTDLVYLLSGSCSDGSLSITSSKKLILALDGLALTNTDGAVIDMLSDKRVMLHLMAGTINNISDGSGTHKGAIQFKGKLDIQGSGTLNISGMAKHAIQSSGKCNMMGGNVYVQTAVKDGLNVDDFVMDGGLLNVNSLGDGIDGDNGYIEINKGTVVVNCPTNDVKGICCDSTLIVNGGNLTVTCSGNQSKCLKSGQATYIYGGTINLHANGTLEMVASGSGYDPSYCTGIKSNTDIYFEGGNTTISCPSGNAGGKGLNADGNIYLNNGTLTINAIGGCGSYNDENNSKKSYASTCVKSNGNIEVNGGTYTLTAGGKAINADGFFYQNGGQMTLTTSANGAVTVGSGSSATDGYTSACVKSDRGIEITCGRLTGTSTGTGGRGMVAPHLTVGTQGSNDNLIDINIYTSGAPVNASSGGGGWPGGGGGSSNQWKGLPKGIRIDSTIVINSGHVSVYCSQTSGDPTAEAIESKGTIIINGGEVEANSYDDAINASQAITINGGKVWAYARGNDGIDCNGSGNININGGLVIVSGTEVGVDADTEKGNKFNLNGGTIVSKGGNMGCWDTPTCTGTQRYITANVTITNGFAIADQNDSILLVFKGTQVSGSGFIDQTNGTGTKPPPGGGGGGSTSGSVGITFPGMVQGTYKVYSNVTISGGSEWHGYYTGATCTTSGTATSTTTR